MTNFSFVRNKIRDNLLNISRHSAKHSVRFINKHKHHAHHFVFATVAILIGIFLYNKFALAASSHFTQNDWTGGDDPSSVAVHSSNQNGWPKYYSSTGLDASSTVSLSTATNLYTDDGIGLGGIDVINGSNQLMGVAVTPNGKFAYTVGQDGFIDQFSRNSATGVLTPLSNPNITAGAAYSITISANSDFAYVPNPTDGVINVYSINQSTGELTYMPSLDVSAGTSPAKMIFSPDNNFAYVVSVDTQDLYEYSYNSATGELTPLSPASINIGISSFGLTISPDGKNLYITSFGSSIIKQYSRDLNTGIVSPLSIPSVTAESSAYSIVISPDGKFAYVPNFDTGYMSQYSRNLSTGYLTSVSTSTVATDGQPFLSAITPDGNELFVTNMSGSVSQYAINKTTGELTSEGSVPSGMYGYGIDVSSDGRNVYVTSMNTGSVYEFIRNVEGQTTSTFFQSGVNAGTFIADSGPTASIELNQLGYLHPMNPLKALQPSNHISNMDLTKTIATSPDGKSVYIYGGSGSNYISLYDSTNKALSWVEDTAFSGSIYDIKVSPDGKSVYVFGESEFNSFDPYNFATTTIYQYNRNISNGKLTYVTSYDGDATIDTANQSLLISPDGKFLYALKSGLHGYDNNNNYHDISGGVYEYARDLDTGALTPLSNPYLDLGINSGFDFVMSPDGKNIYISDTDGSSGFIYQINVDGNTGDLSYEETITDTNMVPLQMVISSDSNSLYAISGSLSSNDQMISEYSINNVTGHLGLLNQSIQPDSPADYDYLSNIAISPDGKSVYVISYSGENIKKSGNIYQYNRDTNTGLLGSLINKVPDHLYATNIAISGDGSALYVTGRNSYIDGILQFNRELSSTLLGTFTSGVFDIGNGSVISNLEWDEILNGGSITIKARSSPSSDFSSATDWTSCTNISNGSPVSSGGCINSGDRYVQYQATLSRNDDSINPKLLDVVISFAQNGNNGTGELISSVYDTEDPASVISNIRWTATNTSNDSTVKFQIRTANSTSTLMAAPWCGPSITCNGSSYFTDPNGVASLPANHPLQNGGNDRYFQYRMLMTANNHTSPVLSSVAVEYVVNVPPEFDSGYGNNGILVETSSATSSTPGVINISYSVRDQDSTNGSVTPGYVTPSFEYNIGAGWVPIASTSLALGDTDNKSVNTNNYSNYTATWVASTTIPNTFTTNARIRVSLNDNEPANNIAQVTSGVFTIDTKSPVVSAIVNASNETPVVNNKPARMILSATDDSQLQYRICADQTFPNGEDALHNDCSWDNSQYSNYFTNNVSSTTIDLAPYNDSYGDGIIYLEVRDVYGNTTRQTIVVPPTPTNFELKDISKVNLNIYKEFLSWDVFSATTSNTFSAYKVYHTTSDDNNATYSLLTTITDPNVNYYLHNITTATSSNQHYKVLTVSAEGNISEYTNILQNTPSSLGGDTTPPVISDILVPPLTIKNNQARVTFNTDKKSKGIVQYHISGDQGWYTASSTSYSNSQSILLTGLTSGATYNIQVSAEDVNGNQSDFVAGPDFETNSGPSITAVTTTSITDNSATIQWNTSTSSDSYVYYSTSPDLSNAITVGSPEMVSCSGVNSCAHSISIGNLTTGHTYYYYVESTDSNGNMSANNNNASYYSFVTAVDTTPPVISNISTPVISSVSVAIVWQTNEPADTQLAWGTKSGELNHITNLNSTKDIYHVVSLSKDTNDTNSLPQTLTPETKYYFKVFSMDSSNNIASSTEQTFSTTADGQVKIVTNYIGGGGGSYTPPQTNTQTKDTTPPVINGARVANIGSFSADVNLSTNEDVVAFVSYGESTNYTSNEADQYYNNLKTIRLSKLKAGTTYHYRVKVIDKSGNATVSTDAVFTTLPLNQISNSKTLLQSATDIEESISKLIESALPSITPPFISTPEISNVTENSATVKWDTNISAFGSVRYATDENYTASSSYGLTASAGQNKELHHSVDLTGLIPNTVYHLQATSYVFPQALGKSPDLVLTTQTAKIKAGVSQKDINSFTIDWSTPDVTTSIIDYKNLTTGEFNHVTDDTFKTYHSVKLSNLTPGTTYVVKVSGINSIGNIVRSGSDLTVMTPFDTVPPIISNFKVDDALVPGNSDFVQTIIGWQTDKPANSAIYYAEGAGTASSTDKDLTNKLELLRDYTNNHILILPSMKAGMVYRIKIVSIDRSGNLQKLGPMTIVTPRQTQSVLDIIFKNFEETFRFLRSPGQQ